MQLVNLFLLNSYEVLDDEICVLIIALGKTDYLQVYRKAKERVQI